MGRQCTIRLKIVQFTGHAGSIPNADQCGSIKIKFQKLIQNKDHCRSLQGKCQKSAGELWCHLVDVLELILPNSHSPKASVGCSARTSLHTYLCRNGSAILDLPPRKAVHVWNRLVDPGYALGRLIPVLSNTIYLPIVDRKIARIDQAIPNVHSRWQVLAGTGAAQKNPPGEPVFCTNSSRLRLTVPISSAPSDTALHGVDSVIDTHNTS